MLRLMFLVVPIVVSFAQSGVTPETCPVTIKSIKNCPVAGCGGVSDAFLNLAKNRTDVPGSGVQNLGVNDIKQIDQPADWKTGKARATITGPGKEGTPVRVTGFLLKAKKEGAETCNCELTKVADTDVHLVVVTSSGDAEESSISAEITPRVRAAGHPNWTFTKVQNKLAGKLIRVTGWLMLDTAHLPHSETVPGEHGHEPLARATNWEVHPIAKLEYCSKTRAVCESGSGWKSF
jgi:hypothetical protein